MFAKDEVRSSCSNHKVSFLTNTCTGVAQKFTFRVRSKIIHHRMKTDFTIAESEMTLKVIINT